MTDFTKPGFYKRRNGGKAEVFAKRNGKLYGIIYSDDSSFAAEWDNAQGEYLVGLKNDLDLIGPWVDEPEKVEGWINVVDGNFWGARSKEQADSSIYKYRIACRRITYTPGTPKSVEECRDIASIAWQGRSHLDRMNNAIDAFLEAYAIGRIMDTTPE